MSMTDFPDARTILMAFQFDDRHAPQIIMSIRSAARWTSTWKGAGSNPTTGNVYENLNVTIRALN